MQWYGNQHWISRDHAYLKYTYIHLSVVVLSLFIRFHEFIFGNENENDRYIQYIYIVYFCGLWHVGEVCVD